MAYALVKWLDGECAGTYTRGVPISWFIDYTEDFMEKSSKRVNVLEWRVGKKPKGGWVCYDVRIIEISDSVPELERKINVMDVPESPRKVPAPKASNDEPKSKRARIESSDSSDSDNDKDPQPKGNLDMTGITPIEEKDAIEKLTDAVEQNTQKLEKLQNDVTQCLNILKSISMAKLPTGTSTPKESKSKEPEPEPSTSDMIEIGHKGSKACVTSEQWLSAKSKATPTHMAITLLTQVFPLDVLLQSNLKGGASKIKTGKPQKKRKALDKSKLQAILEAVRTKFSNTYNESNVRIAINNKLATFRKKREPSTDPTMSQREQVISSDDEVEEDEGKNNVEDTENKKN